MKLLKNILFVVLVIIFNSAIYAQTPIIWMSAGSLHNWYSYYGCERESGNNPSQSEQQYGMRWPAFYQYQDIQAAKGMWIGVKNFVDANGVTWPAKVVHIGPRTTPSPEFFPVTNILKAKYDKPVIKVDGQVSESEATQSKIDLVDPTMKWDREIVTVTNSPVGITTTRRVYQFSDPFHDNYIVNDYTFTNTGKADPDNLDKVVYPNKTLEGVVFYFQFRLAACKNARYAINSATGWGKNTTNDVRGDGNITNVTNPPNWDLPSEDSIRCQFMWHGKYPDFTQYDNIGAPLFAPVASTTWIETGDTIGRFAAPQFAGIATLFASKQAADSVSQLVDDFAQPFTTSTIGSDETLIMSHDANDRGKCVTEYAWMNAGHEPRHLQKMGETDLINPSKDPSLGNSGGQSFATGYGPYNIGPNQSVRIIFVEAVNGMSRDSAVSLGRQFKWKKIDAVKKNQEVMKGKDSLMMTFKRAIANFKSNWTLASAPLPPKEFTVTGMPDSIGLKWSLYDEADPAIQGFEVYRAIGKKDSTYHLIASLPKSARTYYDKKVSRGPQIFYYVKVIGAPVTANPALGIWAGRKESNLNLSLMADATFLKKDPGSAGGGVKPTDVRVVPNPFNYAADATMLKFGENLPNRLYFFNIPGSCTIRIFTEYGELIKTIDHNDGTADQAWDCVTSYNQIVVSGIYIAVVKDNATGTTKTVKFVVIR